MKLYLLFVCILVVFKSNAQYNARYWVSFSDKKNTLNLLQSPSSFVSTKAIERRARNSISITVDDLPVSKKYTDSVSKYGLKLINTSRWFNGALFEVYNEDVILTIEKLSFVLKVEKRRDAENIVLKKKQTEKWFSNESIALNDDLNLYGWGFNPLNLMQGIEVHKKGYKGKGIQIAILDAGFTGYDTTTVFDSLRHNKRLLGYRDFVEPGNQNFAQSTHGTIVLGTMAANSPYTYIGTAPEASYWLLRTEDTESEYPSEEDHWVAAIEFADSAGVDIVNTSLGYKFFDNTIYNHSNSVLDGKSLRISKAAQMAVQRGMILFVSAGNSGKTDNPTIGAPADAIGVITVGAVDVNGTIADFSSIGPTSDGRIKPELVAQGTSIAAFRENGWIAGAARGTSFSSPVLAGLAACLLQYSPYETPARLFDALRYTSSNNTGPNNVIGYGIPNGEKALKYLTENHPAIAFKVKLFPTTMSNFVFIDPVEYSLEKLQIECFNLAGQKQFEISANKSAPVFISSQIQSLMPGVYIFRCSSAHSSVSIKAIKNPRL